MKKHLLSSFLLLFILLFTSNNHINGQTVIASWSFDALLAPTTDVPTAKAIPADNGPLMANANAYLDGTNGSSDWTSVASSPELTAFGGSTLNDPRATPTAGMAMALANMSANGKYVVFKFATTGYSNICFSFATRGTASGFTTHSWAWSTDNVTYTDFASVPAVITSTWAIENHNLANVTALNNASEVYIRLQVDGATTTSGNNRIDNFVVYSDVTAPVATMVPADGATDVAIDVNPTITFDEAARNTDASEITNDNVASLLKFKETNSTGTDVPFTATIDDAKKVITVVPTSALTNAQAYYLEVGEVEDVSGNTGVVTTSTFTTISATTPSLTITAPVTGDTFYAGDNVTITWTYTNLTNVKIDVFESDTYVTTLSSSTPAADQSFSLVIPADAGYSAAYKIRIYNADDENFNVDSDPFTIIGVATSISDLRTRFDAPDVVKLSSEAVFSFIQGKNYYMQDAGAGLLIYDNNLKLTTTYSQYDGITGVTGTLSNYNGVLELVPIADAGAATSTGNTIVPIEVSAATLNSDLNTYESRLVKILAMTFADAGGSFVKGTNYNISDGTTTTVFRAAFTSDITGTTIPNKADIIGLAMEYNGTSQIASRSLADLTILTGINTSAESKVTIYPVPAVTELKITNIESVKLLEVFNVTGIKVAAIKLEGQSYYSLALEDYTPGMYFIRFTTDNGVFMKKFMKR